MAEPFLEAIIHSMHWLKGQNAGNHFFAVPVPCIQIPCIQILFGLSCKFQRHTIRERCHFYLESHLHMCHVRLLIYWYSCRTVCSWTNWVPTIRWCNALPISCIYIHGKVLAHSKLICFRSFHFHIVKNTCSMKGSSAHWEDRSKYCTLYNPVFQKMPSHIWVHEQKALIPRQTECFLTVWHNGSTVLAAVSNSSLNGFF